MSEPVADDGWIKHNGGPCPIPDAKRGNFELRVYSGEILRPTLCDALEYDEDFQSGEIVAYRLRKPTLSDTDLLRQAGEALREFAKQRRTDEMDEDENERADFEGAYDAFIDRSRAVLALIDERMK